MPLATSPPPLSSGEAPESKVRSSISQSVTGRNASAASTPETISPW